MRETPFMGQLRRDLAQAPGRVVLTGFIPPTDMPRAYLLGDVFVGPSQIEEGLGLVFLEAAAAGLPIIATRKGGIPEVVRDDFNGLLLRQPDDAAELAEKITGLLGDAPLRQRLGQQGRDWVRADFSWEKIARTLEEFYDEVMEPEENVGWRTRVRRPPWDECLTCSPLGKAWEQLSPHRQTGTRNLGSLTALAIATEIACIKSS